MTIADIRGSIKGRVDGQAVEAGSVGEKITSSGTGTTGAMSTLTAVDVSNSTLTLTPGIWFVSYFVGANLNGACTVNSAYYNTVDTKILTNTNGAGYVDHTLWLGLISETGDTARSVTVIPRSSTTTLAFTIIVPTGGMLIKLQGRTNSAGFTGVVNFIQTMTIPYAIRIA
jgi:hypothetical protein